MQKRNQKGFTLIEILIVIGIIAILATIVIIAINPARQFAQARNTQRVSNVNTLLNGIGQNIADYKGIFTCAGIGTAVPVVDPMVPNSANALHIGTTVGLVNLTCLAPTYIASSIPMDPSNGLATDTLYTIQIDNSGRYTICAPTSVTEHQISNPGPTICVTR